MSNGALLCVDLREGHGLYILTAANSSSVSITLYLLFVPIHKSFDAFQVYFKKHYLSDRKTSRYSCMTPSTSILVTSQKIGRAKNSCKTLPAKSRPVLILSLYLFHVTFQAFLINRQAPSTISVTICLFVII